MQTPNTGAALAAVEERPLKRAMARGWRRRCPKCGSGPLFSGYLKVADHCAVCGEAFHHQRADDGPAYLTILIVAHMVGFALHLLYSQLRLDPLIMATVLSILCVAASLYLLPRIKGAFVALQWSRRMHGFGREPAPPAKGHETGA
ncbi:uncharacterized protein (DUF983 family) [Aliiruegeria haliotis]|uniref:Uncharacterized protein (DUF983 family) n=1 Tax=Aliiruegeria haliotis TaxID=1280846 RepID=A0A2T0RUS7_9RHOB|nr:DUF983 domain-containing protein [Aliiruegeria haliotis]PRY24914.1 uncharacterized protein (DUF983 family) [Aliiruegeria haliotis]